MGELFAGGGTFYGEHQLVKHSWITEDAQLKVMFCRGSLSKNHHPPKHN